MKVAKSRIGYTRNVDLKKIIEDGIDEANSNACGGFEYIVGEINGYAIKVIMEPKLGCFDTVVIDGVDGLGFSMAFDKD